MKTLTENQKRKLDFIQKFIVEKGFSPSFREIGGAFGVSVRSVADVIFILRKKGYITLESGLARSITINKNPIPKTVSELGIKDIAMNREEAMERYKNMGLKRKMAISKFAEAMKHGHITKKTECQICGKSIPLVGHHFDYDKPLEVLWVCPSCHLKIHKYIIAPIAV